MVGWVSGRSAGAISNPPPFVGACYQFALGSWAGLANYFLSSGIPNRLIGRLPLPIGLAYGVSLGGGGREINTFKKKSVHNIFSELRELPT